MKSWNSRVMVAVLTLLGLFGFDPSRIEAGCYTIWTEPGFDTGCSCHSTRLSATTWTTSLVRLQIPPGLDYCHPSSGTDRRLSWPLIPMASYCHWWPAKIATSRWKR